MILDKTIKPKQQTLEKRRTYASIINFVVIIYVIQRFLYFFSKTLYAGLHYNENANRGRQLDQDSNPVLHVRYIKWQAGKPKVCKNYNPSASGMSHYNHITQIVIDMM